MPRTTFGKTRKANQPYAVYADPRTGWTWKVLKTYKHSDAERKDPYARWYMATSSPWVTDELGDGYAAEVTQNGILIDAEPEWRDEYSV
jgi:hypothetical protein